MYVSTYIATFIQLECHNGPDKSREAQSMPFQFIGLDYLSPKLVNEGSYG